MTNNQSPQVGLTKAISVIYVVLGLAWAVAVLRGAEIAGITLEWRTDIWVPLFWVAISLGTLRRTKWGRWLSYPISAVFLLGVPIGTVLGGFMLWHLTKYRVAFSRWY